MTLERMKHGKVMDHAELQWNSEKTTREERTNIRDMLFDLLQKIFELEEMPEEWRDSVIVTIFKEKIMGITEASRLYITP